MWLLKEKYHGEKTEGFFADLARLESGEPLGYVIGWVPFLDTKIRLDSKPLIPRPETEYWVNLYLNSVVEKNTPLRILDLCAGSGAIGVAVANALPNTQVDLVEIDEAHHPTILVNLQQNGIDTSRAHVIGGDLFDVVPQDVRYNYILTNPPYIDPALDRTEASVKDHEPHRALYGGVKGTELISRIIEGAPDHLEPGGQLWIEHEPEQTSAIHSLSLERYASVRTEKDQYDVERFSILTLR